MFSKGVREHTNSIMHTQENSNPATVKFAETIQKLAEEGSINSMSICISGWSSDELFRLAKEAGIKEVSVTAQFGS